MKNIVKLLLIAVFLIVAAPAHSAVISQFFKCEQDDDATEKDLVTFFSKWEKAAKTMKGGEDMRVSLHFPVAAQMGSFDFSLVLTVDSATQWGEFMDNYAGSAAQAMDGEWDELASCPDSALIKSIGVN